MNRYHNLVRAKISSPSSSVKVMRTRMNGQWKNNHERTVGEKQMHSEIQPTRQISDQHKFGRFINWLDCRACIFRKH